MNLVFANRMNKLAPSPTLALNALAQQMQKSGLDVVNLTAGETDFPTPELVCDAAIKAMHAGKTRYTASHGSAELRKKVSEWFRDRWKINYSEKQITITAGVKQGIFNLALAMINPGDEVIIPAPYWVSYPAIMELAGAVVRYVPTNPKDGFRIDIQQIEKLITAKTRMLILNSPNNPAGSIQSKQDLEKIAKILEGTNIFVLSDEIYSELVYEKDAFVPFASLSPDAFARTITMNGLSKSHAMTGWRVGFVATNEKIIEALGTLQGQSVSNITTFVQDAAIAALDFPQQEIYKMRDSLEERRNFVMEKLSTEKNIILRSPPGAFYCFPDVSFWYGKKNSQGKIISDSSMLSEYLLQEAMVAVVPGIAFGEDRCIRLSFAAKMDILSKGIDRILSALQRLES